MDKKNSKTLFWCSWVGKDDSRPMAWPPPESVVGFWEAGLTSYKDEIDATTVVALVSATTEEEAWATIAQNQCWPEAQDVGRRRSIESVPNWQPTDRFPIPTWSVELRRWPRPTTIAI